jgi:DNA-binding transcriptional LysR family regulator
MINKDDRRLTTHEFAGNLPSLECLRSFVVVAEEASFTRAAARVHVAQPGVSAQVRRLEAELGQQLLDRSGRSVRLTEVGAAVLPFARAALDAVTNARLAVDQLVGLVRGQVAVGMVSGCSLPTLPELLAEFHGLFPGVSIALSEDASGRLIELLRDGRLDLALIGSAGGTTPGLEAAVVADEALVAAVSADKPFALRKSITVDDLRDQPLVSLPQGTGVRAGLEPRSSGEPGSPGAHRAHSRVRPPAGGEPRSGRLAAASMMRHASYGRSRDIFDGPGIGGGPDGLRGRFRKGDVGQRNTPALLDNPSEGFQTVGYPGIFFHSSGRPIVIGSTIS